MKDEATWPAMVIAEEMHLFYKPRGGVCPLERCYNHAQDIMLALAKAGYCVDYVGVEAMVEDVKRHEAAREAMASVGDK